MAHWKKISKITLVLFLLVFSVNVAFSFKERTEKKNAIEAKEFLSDELYISQTNLQLNFVLSQLPNSRSWNNFFQNILIPMFTLTLAQEDPLL